MILAGLDRLGDDETPASIAAWADATFGQPGNLCLVVARSNRELAELVDEHAVYGSTMKLMEEAADVVIPLARLSHLIGFTFTLDTPTPPYTGVTAADLIAQAMRFTGLLYPEVVRLDQFSSHHANLPLIQTHTQTIADHMGQIIWLYGGFRDPRINLQSAVNAKMVTNRERQWIPSADGHWTRDRSAG